MDAGQAREALRQRLGDAGFDLDEATVAEREALVARRADFRWEWFASRLHTFVVVLRVDRLDERLAEELTDAAQRYAMRNKGGLPRGMQTGTATVPVLLADAADESGLSWATSEPRHRYAAMRFPVVVELGSGTPHYFSERLARGWVYGQHLRKLVEDVIRPAVSA